MRDRIVAKGVDPARVVVSRDGIMIPETVPSPDNSVAREIRGDFRFVLVHAGNLGFYGAWQTLISAVRMLENEGVGLVFIGEGAMKPQVEAMAEGCRAIRFLPFRPASEVPLVLSSGDMHVVTVKRGLEGVVVPSKLYPTLAAGRPVLGVAPEESDVVRDHPADRLRHRRQSRRSGERCGGHPRRVARLGTIAKHGRAGRGRSLFPMIE